MTIMFPYCTFKCGAEYCQNSALAHETNIEISIESIIDRYINNPITESIVMQGLEPFDSWGDLCELVEKLRLHTKDDIIIYTGYYNYEIGNYLKKLREYPNIIIKYGRYIPNQTSHYDPVIGIYLASNNQYAERIS
jgi:uncharacterized Fe-S radical SAM superfamily protein PflX